MAHAARVQHSEYHCTILFSLFVIYLQYIGKSVSQECLFTLISINQINIRNSANVKRKSIHPDALLSMRQTKSRQ